MFGARNLFSIIVPFRTRSICLDCYCSQASIPLPEITHQKKKTRKKADTTSVGRKRVEETKTPLKTITSSILLQKLQNLKTPAVELPQQTHTGGSQDSLIFGKGSMVGNWHAVDESHKCTGLHDQSNGAASVGFRGPSLPEDLAPSRLDGQKDASPGSDQKKKKKKKRKKGKKKEKEPLHVPPEESIVTIGSDEFFYGRDSSVSFSEDGKNIKRKYPNVKKSKNLLALKEEFKKQKKELTFIESLSAFVSVCINSEMLNRAVNTVRYYRHLASSHPWYYTFSVQVYNVILRGLAEEGNLTLMKEVVSWMKKDGVQPDVNTFISLLSCIGAQSKCDLYRADAAKIIDNLCAEGLTLRDLFLRGDFVRHEYDNVLAAIKMIHSDFIVPDLQLDLLYNCSLVNELNCFISSQDVSSQKEWLNDDKFSQLIEEQFSLEFNGKLSVENIAATEDNENTQKFGELYHSWEEKWKKDLEEALLDKLEQLKDSFVRSKYKKQISMYPYLVSVPPEVLIQLMMQEIRMHAGGSTGYTQSRTTLFLSLASRVQCYYQIQYKKKIGLMQKIKEKYKEYCYIYHWKKEQGSDFIPRVEWQRLTSLNEIKISLNHTPLEWPPSVLLAIGKFLYGLILSKVMVWKMFTSHRHCFPAFHLIDRSYGLKVMEEIKVSPVLLNTYQRGERGTLMFDADVAPMIVPPMPWISPSSGGFLLAGQNVVRLPFGAYLQKKRMKECGNQQLYPLLDSINQLGSVAWKINEPVLDVVVKIFKDSGDDALSIPRPPSTCPLPKPISPGMSKEEVAKISKERDEVFKKRKEMHSLWWDALYKLSLAHHFRNRQFWLPHNIDFRGRVYPCPPHLHHLSSDVFRSLLCFADGQRLDKEGLRWLKIHTVNLTGLKKQEPLCERLKFCDSVMDEIFDSADNPLTGRKWWTKSSEPLQTLAACIELKQALTSPDPYKFVSHLPVHQDGSCNGLQHYAALGRDQEGAESVNLAPAESPQDVYNVVCGLVNEEIKKDARAGVQVAKDLEGFVTRKVIKQTIMTTVYGVTHFGARLQIEKQLKNLDDFPVSLYWKASLYLVGKTFLALEKMFTSTKEIQHWLGESARSIALVNGKSIEWITPLGLPVVQPYVKMNIKHKPLSNMGTNFAVDTYEKPDSRKQKNGFPPNFIHSLDSTHMMLTSLFCQRAGITFVSVHDCFWTHAASVDLMNKICRQQFLNLHSDPILENLSEFLLETFGHRYKDFSHDGSKMEQEMIKTNILLKNVPKKGSFDIREVLGSTYFFS